MNLRCFYCQTPFTLSTEEKITALRKMHAEDLHHYDAHCPRCGRANPVSRERLEMFTPGWETAIKEPAAGAAVGAAASMPVAPSSTPSPMMGSAEPRTAPAPAMKKEPAKAPARRKHATAAKKTAAAPKRKPAAAKKKTVVKKKPAAKAKPKKTSVKSRKPAAKSKAKAKKR